MFSILENCLYAHNALRGLHPGTPNMTWDTSLATDAQSWADELGEKKKLVHASKSDLNGQGENLYFKGYSGNMKVTCADAVLSW